MNQEIIGSTPAYRLPDTYEYYDIGIHCDVCKCSFRSSKIESDTVSEARHIAEDEYNSAFPFCSHGYGKGRNIQMQHTIGTKW